MGKLTDNLFSGFSGRIGNVLFYQVNGQTFVRKKPGARTSPTTRLQTYHQAAFALVQKFLSPVSKELEIGFGEFRKGAKRGIDRAKSLMLKNAVLPTEGVPVLLPEKMIVSSGDLTPPQGGICTKLESGKYSIQWVQNSWVGSARDSDKSFVVVYDTLACRVFSVQGARYRKDKSQLVELPWSLSNTGPSGSGVYLYFSFYSERKGKKVFSDSVCLGQL